MRPRARRVKRTMVRGIISGRWRGAVGQGLGGVGVSAPAGPPGHARRASPRKRFRGITSPRRRVVADVAAAGCRKVPRISRCDRPGASDSRQGDRIWKFRGGSPTSLSPGRGARGRHLLSSPLPGGRSGGGSRPLGAPAHPGSSRMSGIGKIPVRAAEPLGQPPSRPPPFQGGGEKTQGGGEKAARPASCSAIESVPQKGA